MNLAQDLASWASLVGILLPALVALLQRDHWGDTVNGLIFGASTAAASVVYAWIKYGSDFTWQHWESTLLAVIVWGIATFKLYWKPSGISTKLRAVPIGILPGKVSAPKGKR